MQKIMDENYILAKWLAGEMTEDELASFQLEPDFFIYNNIKKYSSELETPNFEEQKVLATILATPKKEVKTVSLTQNWFFRDRKSVV